MPAIRAKAEEELLRQKKQEEKTKNVYKNREPETGF